MDTIAIDEALDRLRQTAEQMGWALTRRFPDGDLLQSTRSVAREILILFRYGCFQGIESINKAVSDYYAAIELARKAEDQDEFADSVAVTEVEKLSSLFEMVIGGFEGDTWSPSAVKDINPDLPSVDCTNQECYWTLVGPIVSQAVDSIIRHCRPKAQKPVVPMEKELKVILSTMLELKAHDGNRRKASEILRKAGLKGEARELEPLKKLGLVSSQSGVGFQLTELGVKSAQEIERGFDE